MRQDLTALPTNPGRFFHRNPYSHRAIRLESESEIVSNLRLLQLSEIDLQDDRMEFPSREIVRLELLRAMRTVQDRPIAVVSIADAVKGPNQEGKVFDRWDADQSAKLFTLLAEKCWSINCVPLLLYNDATQLMAADIISSSATTKWIDFCANSLHDMREVISRGSLVISESELDGCIANATDTPFVRWPQSSEGILLTSKCSRVFGRASVLCCSASDVWDVGQREGFYSRTGTPRCCMIALVWAIVN